jgi:hypothetical protein
MATNFKNKVLADVGTTPQALVTAGSTAKITVIGLSITNITDGVVLASLQLTDDLGTSGYFIRNVPIPPNQSLRVINGGEKLIVAPSNILTAVADQDTSLDIIASFVEIT